MERAVAEIPTAISAITVFVAVSMTETELLSQVAT
jgi:hypothetical protein